VSGLEPAEARAFAKCYPAHVRHTQAASESMVEAPLAQAQRVPCSCGKRLALSWASILVAAYSMECEACRGEDVLL
jgi:hypothetical protein